MSLFRLEGATPDENDESTERSLAAKLAAVRATAEEAQTTVDASAAQYQTLIREQVAFHANYVPAFDDDPSFGTHHPALTHQYEWLIYTMLFVIVADEQVVAYVGSRDRHKGSRWGVARCFGAFVLDCLCLVVIRHVLISWIFGILVPYAVSAKTSRIQFWDRVDPAPDRPQSAYSYGS